MSITSIPAEDIICLYHARISLMGWCFGMNKTNCMASSVDPDRAASYEEAARSGSTMLVSTN